MDNHRRIQLEQHAIPFLARLLGCSEDDAWMQPVTFQTFTDGTPKPKPDPLAKVIHGSLEDRCELLEELNNRGAGIFVCVNETDQNGRTKSHITQIRGWHTDLDFKDATAPTDDVQGIVRALPLEPTMAVRTPGGLHVYWLAEEPIDSSDECRRKEHEVELKAIQCALAPIGADKKACTVERVLRVPGFFHRKSEPQLVELIDKYGPRCTRDQVQVAYPLVEKETKTARHRVVSQGNRDRAEVLARAGKYLDTIPGSVAGAGGNADGGTKTFSDVLKVIAGFDLAQEEALSLFLEHYNPRCEPPWTEQELVHKVQDAWEAAQESSDRGHLLDGHDRPWVPGFEWDERGLYHLKREKDDDHGTPVYKRTWIAPPFTLPALVRNVDSYGWCMFVAWHDLDGIPHEERVPFELLCGEGAELARMLGQGGLRLSPEPVLRKLLQHYLSNAASKINKRARLVDTLGWHDGAFVLPVGEVIGDAVEPMRYAGEVHGAGLRSVRGTLEGWQAGVAALAIGNPYLAFGLSCAFAGPLLELVRGDGGGGFNFQGSSSKGKTTCLEVAASVWGRPDPLPTWRATTNGLEGIAATRNDGFLPLDELSQVEAKEAGQVAYMLANGAAKARMTREGGNRPQKQWRLIFLSSGEQTLEDKVNEDGRRIRAGQEVRVPDVPFPIEGMFIDAHGMKGFGAFAEYLKCEARKHYGHAIRAFLVDLCNLRRGNESDLASRLRESERAWLESAVPPRADGQVRRVAGRFALVAVAGELARELGILPWPEGEASTAALVCFKAWLERRGHVGASERERGLQAVVDFIRMHGLSKFAPWSDTEAKPFNMAGVRKPVEVPPVKSKLGGSSAGAPEGWDYFLSPTGWKEACKGFNRRDVAHDSIEDGLLEPATKGGEPYQKVRTPHGEGRWYVVRGKALAQFRAEEGA